MGFTDGRTSTACPEPSPTVSVPWAKRSGKEQLQRRVRETGEKRSGEKVWEMLLGQHRGGTEDGGPEGSIGNRL